MLWWKVYCNWADGSFLVLQLNWNHSFQTNVIPEQHWASLYSLYYPKSDTCFHRTSSQLSRKLKQFNHLLSGCPNESEKHSFFTLPKHAFLNRLSKQTQILQWGTTAWQTGCIRDHTSCHHQGAPKITEVKQQHCLSGEKHVYPEIYQNTKKKN